MAMDVEEVSGRNREAALRPISLNIDACPRTPENLDHLYMIWGGLWGIGFPLKTDENAWWTRILQEWWTREGIESHPRLLRRAFQ